MSFLFLETGKKKKQVEGKRLCTIVMGSCGKLLAHVYILYMFISMTINSHVKARVTGRCLNVILT